MKPYSRPEWQLALECALVFLLILLALWLLTAPRMPLDYGAL